MAILVPHETREHLTQRQFFFWRTETII